MKRDKITITNIDPFSSSVFNSKKSLLAEVKLTQTISGIQNSQLKLAGIRKLPVSWFTQENPFAVKTNYVCLPNGAVVDPKILDDSFLRWHVGAIDYNYMTFIKHRNKLDSPLLLRDWLNNDRRNLIYETPGTIHYHYKMKSYIESLDYSMLGGARGWVRPTISEGAALLHKDDLFVISCFNERFNSTRGYYPREVVATLLRKKWEELMALPDPWVGSYILHPNRRVSFMEKVAIINKFPYTHRVDNMSRFFECPPTPYKGPFSIVAADWTNNMDEYIVAYDQELYEREGGLFESNYSCRNANPDPDGAGPGLDEMNLGLLDHELCDLLVVSNPYRGMSIVIPYVDYYFGLLRTFLCSGYQYRSYWTGEMVHGASVERVMDIMKGNVAPFHVYDYGEIFNKVFAQNYDPMTVVEYVFGTQRHDDYVFRFLGNLVQNPKHSHMVNSMIFRSVNYRPLSRTDRINALLKVAEDWDEIQRDYGIYNPAAKYLTPAHVEYDKPLDFKPIDWPFTEDRYKPMYIEHLVGGRVRYINESIVGIITRHPDYFRKIGLSREWHLHYLNSFITLPSDNVFYKKYPRGYDFMPPPPRNNCVSKFLDYFVMGNWHFRRWRRNYFWNKYHESIDSVFNTCDSVVMPIKPFIRSCLDKVFGVPKVISENDDFAVRLADWADRWNDWLFLYLTPEVDAMASIKKLEQKLSHSEEVYNGYFSVIGMRPDFKSFFYATSTIRPSVLHKANPASLVEKEEVADSAITLEQPDVFDVFCKEYINERIAASLNTQLLADIDLDLFAQFIFS